MGCHSPFNRFLQTVVIRILAINGFCDEEQHLLVWETDEDETDAPSASG